MKPQYDQIPEELRALSNWIVWRIEKRTNKTGVVRETKVPYNARSHKLAKSNQPGTWSSFSEALAALARGYAGLGFCLTAPYIGVDLDGCRQKGSEEPWAADILHELNSYSELSPSEHGIHVMVKGELPDGPRQKAFGGEHHGVGLYDAARGRYLTMTGCRIGSSQTIAERTLELRQIHRRLFPPAAAKPKPSPAPEPDLITRARHAQDGGKFARLWDGRWEGDYTSQSEADLALCMKLAFWTNRDAGLMDALFRRSALMRPKWERQDYREATIRKAIEQTTETWNPVVAARKPVPDQTQVPAKAQAKPNGTPPPLVRQESLDIYYADYPEPAPLVDAILYPGLTIFGGRPKIGKSRFSMGLALAVVSGQKVGNYLEVHKPGRCLYVSLEDRPRQVRARLRKLTQPGDYLADLAWIFKMPPLMAGGLAALDRELTARPAEVMILDSLLAAVQQASRRNVDVMQADYNIIASLRELAEKHALALVLIAHTRKAPGDFVDAIQGTSGTTAAADAIWVLHKNSNGATVLSVTGRDLRSNVFALAEAEDSPGWTITGEGEEVAQSEARSDIIELLREQGPMKPSTIARQLHKNISGVHRLLSKLIETGALARTHYGTYQLLPPRIKEIATQEASTQ